jgi:DNA-binding CsgD family transcriptional regulator
MHGHLEFKSSEVPGFKTLLQPRDPCGQLPDRSAVETCDDADALSTREIEVLEWIAAGKSDWQVAQILELSPKTVNYHVEHSKKKLRVSTRIQAVVVAVRLRLISGTWAQ